MYDKLKSAVLEARVKNGMITANRDTQIRIVLNKEDEISLMHDVSKMMFSFKDGSKGIFNFMRIDGINIDGTECEVFRSINGKSYLVVGQMAVSPIYVTYGANSYLSHNELKWQTIEKIEI